MVLVVAVVVIVIVALEMLTAVLPLIIVVVFVPPCERAALAELLAAADSSPKLRLCGRRCHRRRGVARQRGQEGSGSGSQVSDKRRCDPRRRKTR